MNWIIILIAIIFIFCLCRAASHEGLDPTVHYIFWTGGFDSTFRICQLLHNPRFNKPIVPVYIADPMVDGGNGRDNQQVEIATMNRLQRLLVQHFPTARWQLRPTLRINNVDYDYQKDYINKCMAELKKDGCATRMYTQYRSMATVALKNGIIVETGTEGRKDGAVIKHFIKWLEHGYIIGDDAPPHYRLFKNIRWPLSMYKKTDMLEEAKRNNYSKLLSHTFSCWFPTNGIPCGKCDMCRERLKEV